MPLVVLQGNQPRIVPTLADYGLNTYVRPGEPIDVPDDVAGKAPTKNDDTNDLGSGLLAQSDVWALADTADRKDGNG
jgi:hypothetical protein